MAVTNNDGYVLWYEKALIGILGGICLVLIKLIDAKFFVGSWSTNEALAAGLVYLSYLFLAAVAGMFMTDHELMGWKMRKHALLVGFLAPSVFVGLVNKPISNEVDVSKVVIPKLTIIDFFVSPAQANDAPKGFHRASEEKTETSPIDSKVAKRGLKDGTLSTEPFLLTKKQVEPKFGDAVLKVLGRKENIYPYVYVIGSADDLEKANRTARDINTLMVAWSKHYGALPAGMDAKARVIRPEGSKLVFVTVGGLETPERALEIAETVKSAAVHTLKDESVVSSKKTAAQLLDGKVVEGTLLFARNY